MAYTRPGLLLRAAPRHRLIIRAATLAATARLLAITLRQPLPAAHLTTAAG